MPYLCSNKGDGDAWWRDEQIQGWGCSEKRGATSLSEKKCVTLLPQNKTLKK